MGTPGRRKRDITRGTIVERDGANTRIFWWKHRRFGKVEWERLDATNRTDAETEVDARIAEFLADKKKYTQEKIDPPVDAFWEKYVTWARTHRRPATIAIQTTFWNQLIAATGATHLSQITKQSIEQFKDAKRGKRDDDRVKRSINNALKDFQAIFNRAIREGWYTGQNPIIGIERYKTNKALPEPHSEKQINDLLDAAAKVNRTAEWVVLLGAWAGLRRKEITAARWEWFKFDGDEPVIEIRSYEGFELKDHEERTIAMSRRIFDALYPHRKDAGYLFESNHKNEGRHRYRFEARKPLAAALDKAKLSKVDSFQRLRITFACLHAQKGTPIYTVSKWLGHSSVTVTEKYYARAKAYTKAIDAF